MQTLTGLFAAKEAILKCSIQEISLTDLEILPDITGRPNIEGYTVSISHSLDYAVAIAIHNFAMNKNAEVKEKYKDFDNYSSNNSSQLAGVIKNRRFIDYLILGIVLGLVAIESWRLLG